MFLDDAPRPSVPSRWKVGFLLVARSARLCGRLLLRQYRLRRRESILRVEDGTLVGRLIRAILYRALFVPMLLVGLALLQVYIGMHPRLSVGTLDPSSRDVYFEPVRLTSDDGVSSDAWLAPGIEPGRVLADGDNLLKRKRPAVVMVHDLLGSRQQFLPLIRALHDRELVTLTIAPRGVGTSQTAPVTFGWDESRDIRAAVELLRKRVSVDPARITLIGVGTGANACLRFVESDKSMTSLVLIDTWDNSDERLAAHFVPRRWMSPLQPICKWAFELWYGVTADELNVAHYQPLLTAGRVLQLKDSNDWLHDPREIDRIARFCEDRAIRQVSVNAQD